MSELSTIHDVSCALALNTQWEPLEWKFVDFLIFYATHRTLHLVEYRIGGWIRQLKCQQLYVCRNDNSGSIALLLDWVWVRDVLWACRITLLLWWPIGLRTTLLTRILESSNVLSSNSLFPLTMIDHMHFCFEQFQFRRNTVIQRLN